MGMTEQEAIKNVTAYVYMECENMPQQVIKALDIMKNCTEKQIAKKPVHIRYQPKSMNRIHHHIYCGVCGKYSQRVYMGDNYCRRCGQKLDWGNEDAE